MKDNETFLREIYEKALEQQGRKNESGVEISKGWFAMNQVSDSTAL